VRDNYCKKVLRKTIVKLSCNSCQSFTQNYLYHGAADFIRL
jgi:hypothetical protein